jgi:DNA-binding transcriptional ArsR family regulator
MVQTYNKEKARRKKARACCSNLAGLLSPKLFKALSDPKRLSLLLRMAEEQEPCTVSEIAKGSGVDLSVVSRHLGILREAGVILCVKRGKEVRCALQPTRVAKLLRDLAAALEDCCPDGACIQVIGADATGNEAGRREKSKKTD